MKPIIMRGHDYGLEICANKASSKNPFEPTYIQNQYNNKVWKKWAVNKVVEEEIMEIC